MTHPEITNASVDAVVPTIPTFCEVVIVGAGVAGLAAARALDDRDVLILESSTRVGGRTRVDLIAGDHASMGAGVVYRGTPTDLLVRELGITTFPVAPDTYSVHYGGVTVVARTLGELAAGLPLSTQARTELVATLTRIVAEYTRFSHGGLAEAADEIADITFTEYLGACSPVVSELLDGLVFAHSMLRADEVSAKYVLRYLSSKLVKDADHAHWIPVGMQEIADRLKATTTARLALQHSVTWVEPAGEDYLVHVSTPTGKQIVRTREVVLATPGPIVADITPLPAWKTDALASVESVAALIVGVTLRGGAETAWRNVFFVPVIDGVFDYVCTMRVGPEVDPAATSTWQLGMWRDRAVEEMAKTDDQIAAEWIAGLEQVFPGAKEAVLGWSVARWPAGFAIAKPDRRRVLPDVTRPVSGLHFAGDYASESAGTHGAIESGVRAAAEVRKRLLQ